MEKTARQILTDKEVLTVDDIQVIFDGSVKSGKAYTIIRAVNFNSENRLKGMCFTTDFIKHFNLNPADYGRA